jgi:methionine-rich copper-binding protein CopC
MKFFGIITLTLVFLMGASISAMEAGKIANMEPTEQDGNYIIPLQLNNKVEMTALEIPLKFSEGVTLEEVSFDGTRSENFDLKVAKINNDDNTVVIALIPMVYGKNSALEPGQGSVANLEFSVEDPNLDKIEISVTSMENPSHELMFIYQDENKNLIDVTPEMGPISIAFSEITGDNAIVPDEFGLHQNAPNPFNPTTMILYDLPKATNVRMEVYNLLGQNVKTLVNSFQEAGTQSVIWDGTDNDGYQVASGMYFYRIEADDFQATKKMMMLK